MNTHLAALLTALVCAVIAPSAAAQTWDDFARAPELDPQNPGPILGPAFDVEAGFIQTPSGLGVIARGQARYDAASPNRQLALYRQRLAFLRALLDAKRTMLRFLEGATLDARTALAESAETHDSPLLSTLAARTDLDRRIESAAAGVLAGVVVLDMNDDPARGIVTVRLVSSPRTQGLRHAASPDTIYTDNIEQAEQAILDQIARGLTPPGGAAAITNPMTGETALIGYGAAPIADAPAGRAGDFARRSSRTRAALLARRNLVAAMTGERIETTETLAEDFTQTIEDARRFDAQHAGPSITERLGPNAPVSIAELRTDQTTELTVEGELPPGTRELSGPTGDGDWHFHAAIYTLQREPLPLPDAHAPVSAPEPRATPAPEPLPIVDTPPSPCEPAADGSAEVVRAEGEGRTHADAVRDALRSAVLQLNGAAIDANQRYREEFEHTFSDDNTQAAGSALTEDDITVSTGGFVTGFDILARSRTAAGVHRVEICARVPRWTEDWRPGKPTIAVIVPDPLTYRSSEPGRPTPDAVAGALASRLNTLLLESGSFRVIDRTSARVADRELDRIAARVRDGRMAPTELTNLGQQLGADLVTIAQFNHLEHEIRRVPIPGQGNRTETRERLIIDLSVRVVETATGRVVEDQAISRTLTGADLDRLARQEGLRSAKPLLLAATYAAREGAVAAALRALCVTGSAEPVTIAHLSGDTAVLRASPCHPLAPGDRLAVRTPVADAGVTMRVATLTVTDVAPDGSVTARIANDRHLSPDYLRVGLRCDPVRD